VRRHFFRKKRNRSGDIGKIEEGQDDSAKSKD
jgi:hypothetical protein